MKCLLMFVLLIFYPRTSELYITVGLDMRLTKPLLGKWNLQMYPEQRSILFLFEINKTMVEWKNGRFYRNIDIPKGTIINKLIIWDKFYKSRPINEIRLVYPTFVQIYRCENMCATNQNIHRFEVICLPGKWKKTFAHKCQACKSGYWGERCKNKCGCVKDGCDKVDGNCKNWGGCKWRNYGTSCSKTCPDAYFLDAGTGKCSKHCHCFDNSKCNVLTGQCLDNKCDVDYFGLPSCQLDCLYGKNCLRSCHCRKNAVCDSKHGFCPTGCAKRYSRYDCSQYCLPGFYGPDCKKKCHCALPDQCNATNGVCVKGGCDDFHFGKYCDKKCEKNSIKKECNQRCFCKDFTPCGPGKKCRKGCHNRYYGNRCDKTCPAHTYLVNGNCSGKCTCPSAVSCRVTDGTCLKPKCPVGRFGKGCTGKCHCQDQQQCDMSTGYCLDKKCSSAQYYGSDCQLSCNGDYYFEDGKCTGVCHCLNNSNCDVMDGRCIDSPCAPGFTGERCHLDCLDGYFGSGCKFRCHCKYNLVCDRRNGFCEHGCMYGYEGSGCQTVTGFKDLIIQAVIWFVVLSVLLSIAGVLSFFIFKDQKKRDAKTLKLIGSLQKRGYRVTHVRRETITLDMSQDKLNKMTFSGLRGTARLPTSSVSRFSTYRSNYEDDDLFQAGSIDETGLFSRSDSLTHKPKKSIKKSLKTKLKKPFKNSSKKSRKKKKKSRKKGTRADSTDYTVPGIQSADDVLDKESVPFNEAERIPSNGTEKDPSGGTEKVPSGGTEKVPFGGTEKVPSSGTDKVASGGTDKVPSGGTEKVSSGGTESHFSIQTTPFSIGPEKT